MRWKSITFLFIFYTFQLFSYQHELAICAIFKNESPYLKEWIDYHQNKGVDFFLLYNHMSTDDFLEVLEPYIEEGTVEVIDWPRIHAVWSDDQVTALRDGMKRPAAGTDTHTHRQARLCDRRRTLDVR